jgi:hypothetical protein
MGPGVLDEAFRVRMIVGTNEAARQCHRRAAHVLQTSASTVLKRRIRLRPINWGLYPGAM